MGRPHAVAFAWPGQGHINPVMRFSMKLAMKGFMITFVHSTHNLNRITGGNIEYKSYFKKHNLDVHLVGVSDGLPPDNPRDVMDLINAMVDPHGITKHFRELLLHMETPPTCIVADFHVMFTQDFADELNIPRIAIFTQSATSFNCFVAVARGFKPPPDATEDYLITCIPGTKPFKHAYMNTFLRSYDPLDSTFQFMTNPFERLSEPTWIVLNTFKELEETAIEVVKRERDKVIEMGPLFPPSIGVEVGEGGQAFLKEGTSLWHQEEEECLQWLENHPPKSVLYISFGSLITMPRQHWEELASGVVDSGQPFLWVIRPGSIGGETDKFLQGLKESVQGRGLVVSWAPQVDVLTHPSVGAFLTHSGWNSVLESIMSGVPMLAWSFFADQMLVQSFVVEDWGIGLALDAPLAKHDVEKKVKAIMGKDGVSSSSHSITMIRDKSKELSELAKKAISFHEDHGFKSLVEELIGL